MNKQRAALILALASLACAPAFAEGARVGTVGSTTVTTSSGATVQSNSGVLVTPGVPSAAVTVLPAATAVVPSELLLPGGAAVQASSTTVLGGPSGNVSSSKTVVTNYWINVPANVEGRADFRRWQSLR